MYNKKVTQIKKSFKINDTQLLSELKQLGEFTYYPDAGNLGDALIAEATIRWFDKNKLKYKRLQKGKSADILVYGGGGVWVKEWADDLKPLINIMNKSKKIVILPSSFNDVPEFVKILDERFVIFCREQNSYNYLISQNTRAKILLDHDMAFRLTEYEVISWPPISMSLIKRTKKLNNSLKNVSTNEIKFFRTDQESYGNYETDLDLSLIFGFYPYEKRIKTKYKVSKMLETISKFSCIKTDRLHVGIAAALLGVKVYLYDNSYGKISGVYHQSLKYFDNVHLVKTIDKFTN